MIGNHEIFLIGESHESAFNSRKEAEIINDFAPQYILYEGFTNAPEEEIKKFVINFYFDERNKNKAEYVLLEAMLNSGAKLFGCDIRELQELQTKYEISNEDFLGLSTEKASELTELIESKRSNFFTVNKTRSLYMANIILEKSNYGKTLAIIGNGHFKDITEEFKRYNIALRSIQLGNAPPTSNKHILDY